MITAKEAKEKYDKYIEESIEENAVIFEQVKKEVIECLDEEIFESYYYGEIGVDLEDYIDNNKYPTVVLFYKELENFVLEYLINLGYKAKYESSFHKKYLAISWI
jgi:hypothetical protein